MTVLLDSSAFAKIAIEESGTADVMAIAATTRIAASRLAYPEVRGAIARALTRRTVNPAQAAVGRDVLDARWAITAVVELDDVVAREAGRLVDEIAGLRASDAVHLASAITLADELEAFATWDRRLHAAAVAIGIPVFPSHLEVDA